jgi:hypothetical protein
MPRRVGSTASGRRIMSGKRRLDPYGTDRSPPRKKSSLPSLRRASRPIPTIRSRKHSRLGARRWLRCEPDHPRPHLRQAACVSNRLVDESTGRVMFENQFSGLPLNEHIAVIARASHLRVREHFRKRSKRGVGFGVDGRCRLDQRRSRWRVAGCDWAAPAAAWERAKYAKFAAADKIDGLRKHVSLPRRPSSIGRWFGIAHAALSSGCRRPSNCWLTRRNGVAHPRARIRARERSEYIATEFATELGGTNRDWSRRRSTEPSENRDDLGASGTDKNRPI